MVPYNGEIPISGINKYVYLNEEEYEGNFN